MTVERILASWLERQAQDWSAFADQTDLVSVTAASPVRPCSKYVAEFRCTGLVRRADGDVVEADRFLVALQFGEDHLRRIVPTQLVWLLAPHNVWHPNIEFGGGAICPGHLRPGVGLVDVLYQVHSILSYQNFKLDSCLNAEAASWARERLGRFPVDSRPLKRRQFQLAVEEVVE